MLIVVEHFDTFHHYFLTPVYPPLYLTLTIPLASYNRRGGDGEMVSGEKVPPAPGGSRGGGYSLSMLIKALQRYR